jgi:hypothetical protein
MIASGQGEGGEYITAMRDANGSYCDDLYSLLVKAISIKTDFIKGNTVNTWWFNPKTGKATSIGATKKGSLKCYLLQPTVGKENDWVLVIDDSSFKYGEPGKENNYV